MVMSNELNYKYMRSMLKAILDNSSENVILNKNKDNTTYTIYINKDENILNKLSYTIDSQGDTEYFYDLISERESMELFNICSTVGYSIKYLNQRNI